MGRREFPLLLQGGFKVEGIKKELEELGYEGIINTGTMGFGFSRELRDYVFVTFLKKGNSKLIEQLLDLGWEKMREYKTFGSEMYSGYSMTVEYMKFY